MIDTKADTITVEGVVYDVGEEYDSRNGDTIFNLAIDGEEVFPEIEAKMGYDECCEHDSPREWSNVGTLCISYRGYNFGRGDDLDFENEYRDMVMDCDKCEDGWVKADSPHALPGCDPDEDGDVTCGACGGDGDIQLDPVTFFRKVHGARIVMPLYVYEHSGITISCGKNIETLTADDVRSSGRFMGDDAGWDTSTVGFYFDTPSDVKECMGEGATDEQIIKAMDAEIENLASYLEGDVTYFTVDDEETGFGQSCGGFVGGHGDYTKEECFSAIECAIEQRIKENAERTACAERDIITI